MKYAIVYSSQSGNTKTLAEALGRSLKGRDYVLCESRQTRLPEADFYLIGFWTCRGSCDTDSQAVLHRLKNTSVFLFETAGFGGNSSYSQRVLGQVKKCLDPSVEVAGTFMCQGKLPLTSKEKYEKLQRSFFFRFYAKRMLKNYEQASGPPDQQDIQHLCQALRLSLPDSDYLTP